MKMDICDIIIIRKSYGCIHDRLSNIQRDTEILVRRSERGVPCSSLESELIAVALLFFFFTLDAGLLARSQYSEGPATGHLDKVFSWFPCVYKQMLRWFPTFQVATKCFSCSPPDFNLLLTNFIFCIHVK